jgi:hypothetical protein
MIATHAYSHTMIASDKPYLPKQLEIKLWQLGRAYLLTGMCSGRMMEEGFESGVQKEAVVPIFTPPVLAHSCCGAGVQLPWGGVQLPWGGVQLPWGGEEYSCLGEDYSCLGEDYSCRGEKYSCRGEEYSCRGEEYSCTVGRSTAAVGSSTAAVGRSTAAMGRSTAVAATLKQTDLSSPLN